jgi:hypothetical protein
MKIFALLASNSELVPPFVPPHLGLVLKPAPDAASDLEGEAPKPVPDGASSPLGRGGLAQPFLPNGLGSGSATTVLDAASDFEGEAPKPVPDGASSPLGQRGLAQPFLLVPLFGPLRPMV